MNEAGKIIQSGESIFSAARQSAPATHPEHTLEQVGVVNDVVFINDSRSTDIKLTCKSVTAINAEIVLITGGRDGKTDYSYLYDTDLSKLKAIIYLGEQSERIFHLFTKMEMLLVKAEGLDEAVKIARKYAKKEQVVLFSPACPSFDAFDNYKNRGNKFRNLIIAMQ